MNLLKAGYVIDRLEVGDTDVTIRLANGVVFTFVSHQNQSIYVSASKMGADHHLETEQISSNSVRVSYHNG